MNTNVLRRKLRYVGAASLIAMGCSASTGDPGDDEIFKGTDPSQGDEVSETEQPLVGGDLRGRWRFNESGGQRVFDSFGLNNGFLGRSILPDNNDPLRSDLQHPNEGFSGRALRFRGEGLNAPPRHDFVTVRDNEDMERLETGRVSVEAWIRTNNAPTTFGYIVSKGVDVLPGDCSAASYFLYMDSSGRVRFGVTHTGQSLRESPASTALTNNEWHHLVGTYDGTAARLYVDGVQVAGATTGSLAFVSYAEGKSSNLYFGAYNHPTREDCKLPYTGLIDDVRIYRGALTAADVRERYGMPDARPDADRDGVRDDLDECPNTPSNTPVSDRGCSCGQIQSRVSAACPTTRPNPSFCYRNHGAYVSCVDRELQLTAGEDYESFTCAARIQTAAAQSNIGQPGNALRCD